MIFTVTDISGFSEDSGFKDEEYSLNDDDSGNLVISQPSSSESSGEIRRYIFIYVSVIAHCI